MLKSVSCPWCGNQGKSWQKTIDYGIDVAQENYFIIDVYQCNKCYNDYSVRTEGILTPFKMETV